MRMEKMTYFSYKLKTDSAPTINIFKKNKKNKCYFGIQSERYWLYLSRYR